MNPAWIAVAISTAALVVSAGSASFTVLSVVRAQENLGVAVQRDLKAGLEPTPLGMSMVKFEAPMGLRSHWIVRLANISTASTLSIVHIEVEIDQFLGNRTILPDFLDVSYGVTSPCSPLGTSGTLDTPIKLAAGETITLTCDAKISMTPDTANIFQNGHPAANKGEYAMFPEVGFDMFGNTGLETPDGLFASTQQTPVKQPRLIFTAETARGNFYSATGEWYRSLSRLVGVEDRRLAK